MKKILIIRFSSFGDIVQALSIVGPLLSKYPLSQISWLTRKDMAALLSMESRINHIIEFDKKNGLWGLLKLAWRLRQENFDMIYDAHSNLRSRIISFFLHPSFFSSNILVRRSKERWKRFLLFNFNRNLFPWPYRGMISYQAPLSAIGVVPSDNPRLDWNVSNQVLSTFLPQINNKFGPKNKFITLVPSAAWEMKRWPVDYWEKLIRSMPKANFVILGGPDDHFCTNLEAISPANVLNLAGKLSLLASCAVIRESTLLISADTGLLHVADIFQKAAIAIIGPTAFGFPTNSSVKTMEIDLPCRPCTKDGRGKCKQVIYQRCMVEIVPEKIVEHIRNFFPAFL
ncbi:MAG: hypothetical protein A2504_05690 [Bdellovibrionales bacterium RIFOXYD12_FULL_39_22]|nr:MAG: hypothetical protein A2385_06135 [Bdellovibrionales bacterium RIFOXYB1_FULL_39_21]OFZ41858.1 MAG: hypothetical protein A2485_08105 [Bdellovibrionales bacterium RIFOXYC12_FULL_39_17]OFZ50574.1 MAG: hypothetical protein A2404_05055 [Bdellovibrionales bacterium RIFOXYC1_FULL_39_130]OFZ77797.1 MAG: hypothetical protein A2560_00225 [Bdellovibrionales bacterium RIFOXYD1_FULL_39_84]OFZ93767.1 MAG: hypothetical protein A2504_05690 [Bdellovibrionales bacterium RIFOXYD12_FULL_39_22]HLE11547.1 gl